MTDCLQEGPAKTGAGSIDLVLVTWNRATELAKLLDSIDRQTIRPLIRVMVVDNGSTDDTRTMLAGRATPVECVWLGRNVGPAVGRNIGLRLTTAPLVAFADTDAWLEHDDILEKAASHLNADAQCCGFSTVIYLDERHEGIFCRGCYYTEFGHFDPDRTFAQAHDPHFLSTCFAVYRRADLERAGGFDPFYGYGIEDVDLAATVKRSTRGHFHVDETRAVIHEMSMSGREFHWYDFDRKFRYFEWNRQYLVLRQMGLRHWLWATLRLPFTRGYMWKVYKHPLTLRQKLQAAVGYPALAALCLPSLLLRRRRNHLAAVETKTLPPPERLGGPTGA